MWDALDLELTAVITVFVLLLHNNAIVLEVGKVKDVKPQIVQAFLTVMTKGTVMEASTHHAVQTALMEPWE